MTAEPSRAAARAKRRRSLPAAGGVHLAVVDPAAGRAGTPTPSERMAHYIALLRKGEPPHGWPTRQAEAWGITSQVVRDELEEARQQLAASRTPDAAQVLAHELIVQSVETADDIEAKAAEVDNPVEQGRLMAEAAKIKLKAAAELRQLYRKPSAGMVLVQPPGAPGLGGLR